MTASLLLLFLFLVTVTAQNSEEPTIKRNERFSFKNPFIENIFYSQFGLMPQNEGRIQSDMPVFAKIIPINFQNKQVGPSFTGYVYSSDVPSFRHQNYKTPCRKETEANTEGSSLKPQINELMTNLNELSRKVQTLAELFSLKNKIDATEVYELDSQENNDTSTITDENKATLPEIEIIERTETARMPETTTATNVNTQSQIFQCEGVTCPTATVSCKVVERSVEPTHEKVVKTVFCFDKHGNTIKQVEKRVMNPNKGSSLNSSRTHDNNSHAGSSKEKENFQTEMRNFHNQMNSAFGHF